MRGAGDSPSYDGWMVSIVLNHKAESLPTGHRFYDHSFYSLTSTARTIYTHSTTMKEPQQDKQTPDVTIGGGTAQIAYRAPEGDNPRRPGEPLALPPNTSFAKFQQFTQRAADICGDENVTVISDESELEHENYMNPSKAHDVDQLYERVRAVNTD